MMIKRRYLFALLLIASLAMVWSVWAQDDAPSPLLEVTNVNPTDLPQVITTANILDRFGQPIGALSAEQVRVGGDLADVARVVSVENIRDDNLPIAVVLTIDTSSSMAGEPIDKAKAAARLFVEQLGDEDSVALVQFDNRARVVLDYTTDKQAVLNTIDQLPVGGQTALYDAGLLTVEQAANAPVNRRVAVLLGDGAEYEVGRSAADRADALAQALSDGVPVYTVGLGFGTDRTYLRELAEQTNGRFYESPTPDELETIYSELAGFLRSQYVVTLDVDVPADGAAYEFTLEADIDGVTASDSATLYTPIPVPIVTVAGLPEGELTEPTFVAVEVFADDALTDISVGYDGDAPQSVEFDASGSAIFEVNPSDFAAGEHTLSATATDEDGDAGTVETAFTVAALPPSVTITSAVNTDDESITYMIVDVVPDAGNQSALTDVSALAGDVPLNFAAGDDGAYRGAFEALFLPSGDVPLSVTVENANGITETVEAVMSVPPVSPRVRLSLSDGAVLDGPTTVTADVQAQSGSYSVGYQVDGGDIISADGDSFTLDVVALGAGEHLLAVNVADDNGEVTRREVAFTVSDSAIPTPTPTPTATPDAAATQSALDAAATSDAQAALAANATADAASTQAARDALATTDAQATADTIAANATLDALATVDAQAAVDNATSTAIAVDMAQVALSTAHAEATADTRATLEMLELERDTQATANAQATLNAQATQDALDTQATADVRLTVNAQNRIDTVATRQAQANTDSRATLAAMSTARAQSTLDVALAVTAAYEATINAERANAQATLDALPTATPTGGPRDVPSATPIGTPEVVSVAGGGNPLSALPPFMLWVIGGGFVLLILLVIILSALRRRRE